MSDALDRAFAELRRELKDPNSLKATHADPFFYLVHSPDKTIEVQRRLPRWIAALTADQWTVGTHSLGSLTWDLVERSGRWDDWMECEEPGRYMEATRSMRDVLRDDEARRSKGLVGRLEDILIGDHPQRLTILTDAALLHPWFNKLRVIEGHFHDRLSGPVVMLFPGRRVGKHELHFLGFHSPEGPYRATIVGGEL